MNEKVILKGQTYLYTGAPGDSSNLNPSNGTGRLPKSCRELSELFGIKTDGVHTINPDGGVPIKVFCDLTSLRGGVGFILLLTASTHRGWTPCNIKSRQMENPSLKGCCCHQPTYLLHACLFVLCSGCRLFAPYNTLLAVEHLSLCPMRWW